jgi:hypothetical protein
MEKVLEVVNKETFSSKTSFYCGRYIVGCVFDIITNCHAAWVLVVLAHAIQLEHWSSKLPVSLEKTLGVTFVTKLRAILLMEADFNTSNKIIYGVRMVSKIQGHDLLPEKYLPKRIEWQMTKYSQKTLFYDVTQQALVPVAIALVNTSNCYNRIAH